MQIGMIGLGRMGASTVTTALAADPALAGFEGRVAGSGECRGTIQTAIDEAVPMASRQRCCPPRSPR